MNMQHWHLAITPLSPVHMGTDADYEPTGYVIEDGTLYEFDSLAALTVLPQPERKRLDKILNGRPNQDMLLQVQSFFYHNRERLIAAARHQVQVNPSVEAFYNERIGRVSQHESGGRRVQNRLEIERTAWNSVTGQATLPGSGLKGAIRTALLDAENNGQPLCYALKNDRQANRKLQQELFQGSFHTDPLRLIMMGDANLNQPQQFATQVHFALNRKKETVTDSSGNLRQSRAEQAGLYQLLECLPAMQPRAFYSNLSIQRESKMPEQKWPSMQFTLAEIARACNQFYLARLQAELTLLRKRSYIDKTWSDRLDLLLSQDWLSQALAKNRAFLLRVGRHSGAESVTLNGLRDIKVMKGRDKRPDYLDHAKTLWLAGDQRQLQTNLLPFGWLLVEPFVEPSELPAWPAQAEDKSISQWRLEIDQQQKKEKERLQKQQEAARLARKEAEKRKAEAVVAEQARKQAEAEQAAEAQAAFAALSENRKRLHKLNELFETIKAQPESVRDESGVNQLLNEIKDEAPSWADTRERESLAVFLESYYDLIGWYRSGIPKKKKVNQEKKKRELIAKIRLGHSLR